MESLDKREPQGSLFFFTLLVLAIQCLGLAAVIMVAVWMGHFRNGFSWQSNPATEFNYHPVFMVIGMLFLYSDAILSYRVFRNVRKSYIKVVHGGIQAAALIFAGVGLKAVFDSHNLAEKPIPNLYSLHSWLGLSTVILFGLQWLCALMIFVVPKLSQPLREMYMPLHIFWGIGVLIMAAGAALTGITEKALFAVKDYSQYSHEGLLLNFLGVVIVMLVLLVVYVVTRPEYKRQPSPEEERIQLVG